MIKFQGRSTLKQYMPIKRGIKVWDIVPMVISVDWMGKQEIRQVGLGEHVVKKLTSGLKRKNHSVYFDNFFTSVKLLDDLLRMVSMVVGLHAWTGKAFLLH